MCGIAGWIGRPQIGRAEAALRAMIATLEHRGPDGGGIFFETAQPDAVEVALGHRRLAIIDPQGGVQPMVDASAKLALVFNGEIYNFRELREELRVAGFCFYSDSDTEVVLRAYQYWGETTPSRLRGMFAFALWDGARQQLFLARDRFGKKPIYLRQSGPDLMFASEVKALLTLPGAELSVDHEALWEYFAYRYVPAPRTLFKGIHKLMPGTVLTWRAGQIATRRFYTPPDHHPRLLKLPAAGATALFRDKLEEAVRIRMVSDVPFGAFLSGGIDSSAVVAFMARHASVPVKTFSVGFHESAFSELDIAAQVAAHLGTEHHALQVSHDDTMALLPQLVWMRGAPLSEPSDVPIYLLAQEARRHVKMVLTGEGSDEVLGGYPKHIYEPISHVYRWLPESLRKGLMEPLATALPYRFHRIKTALRAMGIASDAERATRWFGALSAADRSALAAGQVSRATTFHGPQFDTITGNSPLRRILFFDQTSWLPDNLLERADSMMMSASIEGRMPFMDHELVDLVSRFPDHCRVRGTTTKYILRAALRPFLPAAILARKKVGFRVPVEGWLRGGMRDFLMDHLTGASARSVVYYSRPRLECLVQEHMQGRQNHEKLLWMLLNLELWHRAYRPAA